MKPSNSANSATPNTGSNGCAPKQGGFINTLIESARRQENLIDALAEAIDAGNDKIIIEAAKALIANRRRDTSSPPAK